MPAVPQTVTAAPSGLCGTKGDLTGVGAARSVSSSERDVRSAVATPGRTRPAAPGLSYRPAAGGPGGTSPPSEVHRRVRSVRDNATCVAQAAASYADSVAMTPAVAGLVTVGEGSGAAAAVQLPDGLSDDDRSPLEDDRAVSDRVSHWEDVPPPVQKVILPPPRGAGNGASKSRAQDSRRPKTVTIKPRRARPVGAVQFVPRVDRNAGAPLKLPRNATVITLPQSIPSAGIEPAGSLDDGTADLSSRGAHRRRWTRQLPDSTHGALNNLSSWSARKTLTHTHVSRARCPDCYRNLC